MIAWGVCKFVNSSTVSISTAIISINKLFIGGLIKIYDTFSRARDGPNIGSLIEFNSVLIWEDRRINSGYGYS